MDYAAAFALAVSGDVSRARALADGLARDYPEDTSVQFMYLPTLRALFALDAGDAAAAIQSLQPASRFDLAMGGIGFNAHFGKLYPIYVRGLAYLAAQQPAEAAAEFQRIVDHRSIVLVDPDRRVGAAAAGKSACALGRHGQGEKRVRRSVGAVGVTPTPASHSSTKHGRNVRARSDIGDRRWWVRPHNVGSENRSCNEVRDAAARRRIAAGHHRSRRRRHVRDEVPRRWTRTEGSRGRVARWRIGARRRASGARHCLGGIGSRPRAHGARPRDPKLDPRECGSEPRSRLPAGLGNLRSRYGESAARSSRPPSSGSMRS